jgi:hypothetical protein
MPRMKSPAYLGGDPKLICLNCDPPTTGNARYPMNIVSQRCLLSAQDLSNEKKPLIEYQYQVLATI